MTFEYTKGAAGTYREWLLLLGPYAKLTAERFRPWERYEHEATGEIVSIVRYADNGTVTIRIEDGPDIGKEVDEVDAGFLELFDIPALDAARN